jgi:hypothetical protein
VTPDRIAPGVTGEMPEMTEKLALRLGCASGMERASAADGLVLASGHDLVRFAQIVLRNWASTPDARRHAREAAEGIAARQTPTDDQILALAHRTATTYAHRSDPKDHGYAFVRHTILNFARRLLTLRDGGSVPAPEVPAMNERIAAALECLEDNDNHGATVIMKAALGVEATSTTQEKAR